MQIASRLHTCFASVRNDAHIIVFIFLLIPQFSFSQSDSSFIKRQASDTSRLSMNLDAVYNRPFLKFGKMPVALGGYAEANTAYFSENGVTEGLSFQARRFTLFFSSTIHDRIRFLSELEFEDGTKEINIEFASVDIEFHPALNLRGGIVMNPIGAFNQNHDSPKWDFVDRPISATQMLPATWSNVGFGLHGKFCPSSWAIAYEAYLTNGFDDKIISNSENKTFLPASKENPERFEESNNGIPLVTAKFALKKNGLGEIGFSYMGGVYNKFKEDGIELDEKRRLDVFAVDMNTEIKFTRTAITAEWAWIMVDVPVTYTQQYGDRQQGGFIDFVQPVIKRKMIGFDKAVLNAGFRFEYVDWNVGTFRETGGNIADDLIAIVPALSWRPTAQIVLRFNYRYHWQRDLLGNPPAHIAGFQFGIAGYF